MDSLKTKNIKQETYAKKIYYNSTIEIRALVGELESKVRILKDSGIKKEKAIELFFKKKKTISDFEKYLKFNCQEKWFKIENKIRNSIELIYS
jgi:hypothetical protein